MSWMNVRPYPDSDTCRVPTRPSSWASGGIRHDFAPVWCGTSPKQACLARDPKGPSTSSCRKENCLGLRNAARDHADVVVVSHSWVLLNSIRSALTHALPRLPCITLSTVFVFTQDYAWVCFRYLFFWFLVELHSCAFLWTMPTERWRAESSAPASVHDRFPLCKHHL